MNIISIIEKKKKGEPLSKKEIEYFVDGVTKGEIPDYQASALLMAIYFQKMNKEETIDLTYAMRNSGDIIDLSSINGIKVDKHSTGGIGDKTTFVVAPIAAAAGVPIAKMSGRGLGYTGGTVDKMESIPGFKSSLKIEEFINLIKKNDIAITGQTGEIALADKAIYSLRDVTATVDNISLVASSVMSKKLASGSDAIVLDVKYGKGSFMENKEDAVELGELMVEIGNSAGKKTVAFITNMNEPLGKTVGNSLEVMEAIDVLKGKGPKATEELSINLSGAMIFLGGKADSFDEGKKISKAVLSSGKALEKLKVFIGAQGGNSRVIDDYGLFPTSKHQVEVYSHKKGYVNSINAAKIGEIAQEIGAGRKMKNEKIDLGAGIKIEADLGIKINKGQILATIYSEDVNILEEIKHKIEAAFIIDEYLKEKESLVFSRIGI